MTDEKYITWKLSFLGSRKAVEVGMVSPGPLQQEGMSACSRQEVGLGLPEGGVPLLGIILEMLGSFLKP